MATICEKMSCGLKAFEGEAPVVAPPPPLAAIRWFVVALDEDDDDDDVAVAGVGALMRRSGIIVSLSLSLFSFLGRFELFEFLGDQILWVI